MNRVPTALAATLLLLLAGAVALADEAAEVPGGYTITEILAKHEEGVSKLHSARYTYTWHEENIAHSGELRALRQTEGEVAFKGGEFYFCQAERLSVQGEKVRELPSITVMNDVYGVRLDIPPEMTWGMYGMTRQRRNTRGEFPRGTRMYFMTDTPMAEVYGYGVGRISAVPEDYLLRTRLLRKLASDDLERPVGGLAQWRHVIGERPEDVCMLLEHNDLILKLVFDSSMNYLLRLYDVKSGSSFRRTTEVQFDVFEGIPFPIQMSSVISNQESTIETRIELTKVEVNAALPDSLFADSEILNYASDLDHVTYRIQADDGSVAQTRYFVRGREVVEAQGRRAQQAGAPMVVGGQFLPPEQAERWREVTHSAERRARTPARVSAYLMLGGILLLIAGVIWKVVLLLR